MIFLVIILVGIPLLFILYSFLKGYSEIYYYTNYNSIDEKTDTEIEKYVTKFINEKYNIDCTLKLEKKELTDFCIFPIDGDCAKAKNTNVYDYTFIGTDQNNNEFTIIYTNAYIGEKKEHPSTIKDNYNEIVPNN